MVRKTILLFSFLIFGFAAQAQLVEYDSLFAQTEQFARNFLTREQDTNYIRNYSDRLALKLVGVNKFNFFQLYDRRAESMVIYRPDLGVNMGVGLSYRWFSIDLAFSLSFLQEKAIDEARFFDFQGAFYSSEQYMEGVYQYYYGYRLADHRGSDTIISDESKIRSDVRTINISLQYLYAFNYDKFSLKAPFVLNEIQRKSAGSVIGGVSFSQFSVDGDSALVPREMRSDFDPQLEMKDMLVVNFGVNLGYMYTAVLKEKFFLTLGLIPGMGLNFGDYEQDRRRRMDPNLGFRLKTMNAIGYNADRFFTGLQFTGSLFSVGLGERRGAQISHGKFKLFVGYRFKP
ncbi:DUF4421 family protein [bacterium SCSIO 12741]|nr:DUF4421 family protein [bacterium SCSIO 12741]